jgi:nucleosome binding factor SPN SPT16 subunit
MTNEIENDEIESRCLYCNVEIDLDEKYCSQEHKTEIYYSKCKVILLWANINPFFDKKFIQSIVNWYLKKGKISDKQQISIDNIINKCRIPYDGYCINCNDTGIAYLCDDCHGECVFCNKYHNFLKS